MIRLSIPHPKVIESPDPQEIEMIRLFRGLNGYLVLTGCLAASSTAVAAEFDDEPPSVDALAGTWNVTTTQSPDGSCGIGESGTTNAYVWIVSTKPDGKVSVSVQGKTEFPALNGTLVGSELKVSGFTKLEFEYARLTSSGNAYTPKNYGKYVGAESWFKLNFSGSEVVGIRRYLGQRTIKTTKGVDATVPCFIDYEVRATR